MTIELMLEVKIEADSPEAAVHNVIANLPTVTSSWNYTLFASDDSTQLIGGGTLTRNPDGTISQSDLWEE